MSDSTKLRNLLNKTNPSLQLEIRKKKPTSSKQFLEYAIEIEELFQLSNIDISKNTNDNNNIVSSVATTLTSTRPHKTQINHNSTAPSAPNTETIQHNSHNYNNRNTNNSNRFPQSSASYNPNHRPKHQPHNSWYLPYESVPSYPQIYRDQQTSYPNPNQPTVYPNSNQPSFNNYPKQQYRSNYNRNNNSYKSNNQQKNYNPTPRTNNISITNLPSLFDPLQPSSQPITCSRCQQSGHEASACPRF